MSENPASLRARAAEQSLPPPNGAGGEHTSNHIVRDILTYLQERRLQPGDRLPSERALAEKLGVGRNALREALATLTTLRVVEARPYSGIYLRRLSTDSSFETLVVLADLGAVPTPAEIGETMEVRAALEQLAVKLACMRRDDADLARLRSNVERTERQLRAGGNISEDDTDFHLALVGSSHNDVLVRVLNAFYRLTAQRRRAVFASREHGRASARDHKKLVEAIDKRDIDAAQELIRRHMDRARSYWKEVLGPD
ncbi:MAG TPA: FadR/GntR family transcriptional regulator [Caldimonas sp.]|jgi:DNA-binding FadR family transcriptional regulator|nr:FadR/GntR family transcriptional regulator [Caldimonas sp.]HEX2540362.1 FadR/GntR family transcriptional regulator [Caldimonas sp.]